MRRYYSCRMQWIGIFLGLGILAGAASAQGITQRDLTRIRASAEEEPRLRINAGGHTATIQALAFTPDSQRLCSAGLDKDVLVWNLGAMRDLRRVFLRERTIRWQVARGLRGSIYALAVAPNDGLLAIGGYGADASLGEILLVNPVSGALVKVLEGHRQTICCLAFSRDGSHLVSADSQGRILLWSCKTWEPSTLYEPDEKTYGPEIAGEIARQPKLRPVAILGNEDVLAPVFAGRKGEKRLSWKLARIPIAHPRDVQTLDTVHYSMVTALATAADGTRLASADREGALYLWDFSPSGPPRVERLPAGRIVLSLCFSPDGRTLLAGTALAEPAAAGEQTESELQIWDLDSRRISGRRTLLDHVHACTFSPDGKRMAYDGGKNNEIFVETRGAAEKPVVLKGTGRKILKVAFAAQKPFYRVAFGTEFNQRGFNDYADLEEIFDTPHLALESGQKVVPGDWLSANWLPGPWSVKKLPGGDLQLYRDHVPKGTISLAPQVPDLEEGRPRSYCWLPDAQGKPFAIVVGTDTQNSIYVCRLVEQGPCPILRHFRGHNDYVTSLGVSRDLRLLVSGSADGTIKIWRLADYPVGGTLTDRWGAEFAVRDGQLISVKVHPAGPLFSKGLREGDRLTEIQWGSTKHAETQPGAMLEKLRQWPWGTPVIFATERAGKARPPFQLLPAWQPLATLFVSSRREWAFWTPDGYYDASFNGHRLFGWQVNRGLRRLPNFYRADQFFKKLERPDVMEHLLSAGSLQEAFRQAAAQVPADLPETLPQQIAATPRVEILEPRAGQLVQQVATRVRARIEVPPDRQLLGVRVFANGVVGSEQKLVEQHELERGKELTYEWNLALPRDQRDLIQVVAGTDAPAAAFDDILVERQPPPEKHPPKFYILALGINQYGDPEIQSLSFPVADAEAVVDLLRRRAQGLYALDEADLLTNQQVTPEKFRAAIERLSAELKTEAQPDDVILFFLAGHGVLDEKTNKYYFVGHDFQRADYDKGIYKGCISWDDFRVMTDIPCRKLALLDTCHSGAIQPPRSRDLKAAVRQMQEDVIFTVTASTGDQQSAEKKEWRHGAFTKCLLEGLGGRADDTGDGVVTLDELIDYLKQSVMKLTDDLQTPTAAPDDILPYTVLPLTRVPPSPAKP